MGRKKRNLPEKKNKRKEGREKMETKVNAGNNYWGVVTLNRYPVPSAPHRRT